MTVHSNAKFTYSYLQELKHSHNNEKILFSISRPLKRIFNYNKMRLDQTHIKGSQWTVHYERPYWHIKIHIERMFILDGFSWNLI